MAPSKAVQGSAGTAGGNLFQLIIELLNIN